MGKFDIFGTASAGPRSPYHDIGFPRNPFEDQGGGASPFFIEHIVDQVQRIQTWVRDIDSDATRTPLSLLGSVGTGKSRILEEIRQHLRQWPVTEKTLVFSTILTADGHARASVGGLLMAGLEEIGQFAPGAEASVLPIVAGIADAKIRVSNDSSSLGRALLAAQRARGDERKKLVADISAWLRRQPLSPARIRASGLSRTLDWEGQLIPVVADLLRTARQVGLLRHLFVFLDQLEDLFRKNFSELRRSRLLTDLRALIDQIDQGTPIGLILAITPEELTELAQKYEALASRLQRNRIVLPAMERKHARPFAELWISALRGQPYFDPSKQPKATVLADEAWATLRTEKRLLPNDTATPRELLTALRAAVDSRI